MRDLMAAPLAAVPQAPGIGEKPLEAAMVRGLAGCAFKITGGWTMLGMGEVSQCEWGTEAS